MTRRPVVTLDGPAGAGKSTVSRAVAAQLGYTFLDTGALYRSVALAAARAGLDTGDERALGELASSLAESHTVAFSGPVTEQRVTLNGEDISDAIRSQRVGSLASRISALGAVRAALLGLQRSFATEGGIVAEGRDLGTVVFPDAEAKFYVTATSEVRAQRRFLELASRGESPTFDEVHREILERDRRDRQRSVAPLRKADDAVEVDCSRLSVDEVVARIVERVRAVAAAIERAPING
jgi:cytidylate kinase